MYPHHIDEMVELIHAALVEHANFHEGIRSALESYWADKIAIVWDVDDVQNACPGLTDEQAAEVLQAVLDHEDAAVGVTWESFILRARQLFDYDRKQAIKGDVEALVARLVAAGDRDSLKKIFDTTDPNVAVDSLDEDDLEYIYENYCRED
jgi:hypothetical protein